MRLWIDITNSPHVLFFSQFIKDIEKHHDVIITSRPLANTLELLELGEFNYTIVGGHYGKKTINKIVGFGLRVRQLYNYLRNKHIDVAISHSSFYSPLVAKLLGARSIYLNDNEHAAGNFIAFKFSDIIMIPEFLDTEKIKRRGASGNKIVKYPGVKEGIYLWTNNYSTYKSNHSKKCIFLRPEPNTAQYYKGKTDFMDELIISLLSKYNVRLLPRNDIQLQYYKQNKFDGLFVHEQSLELSQIVKEADLFIGAGGTMTREMAILGIPTISIYQDELLQVDQYLINSGNMIHNKTPDFQFINQFMTRSTRQDPRDDLIRKGRDAYELIMDQIFMKSK